LGVNGYRIDLAIPIRVEAAQDPAAAGGSAERSLLVHRDIDLTARARADCDRVVHFRRGGVQSDIESGWDRDLATKCLLVNRPGVGRGAGATEPAAGRRAECELRDVASPLARELVSDHRGTFLSKRLEIWRLRNSRTVRADAHERLPLRRDRVYFLI